MLSSKLMLYKLVRFQQEVSTVLFVDKGDPPFMIACFFHRIYGTQKNISLLTLVELLYELFFFFLDSQTKTLTKGY